MIALQNASLVDFLNPSLQSDDGFVSIAKALDPSLQQFVAAIGNAIIYPAIDNLPPDILDFLAQYHFFVDGYNTALPLISRQNLVKNVILNKSRKGTVAAVENILALTLNYAEVVEWWQTTPQGAHDTFYVNIAAGNPTSDQLAIATANVLAMKPARDLFTGFRGFDYALAPAILYTTVGMVEYDYFVLGNQDLQLISTYPTGN